VSDELKSLPKPDHPGIPDRAGFGRFVPPNLHFVPNCLHLRHAARIVVSQLSSVRLLPPRDGGSLTLPQIVAGAFGGTEDSTFRAIVDTGSGGVLPVTFFLQEIQGYSGVP